MPRKVICAPMKSGFVLVVTLLLFVMLIVLAMGMMSLSAVELRVAARDMVVAEARANARLAMMLALGDVQRLAGPDARITATAGIAGTADGMPLEAGEEPGNSHSVSGNPKGLVAPAGGARRWTGVWRNMDDAGRVFDKTPCVGLLGWLVSGDMPDPGDPALALTESGGPADPRRAVELQEGVTAPWLDLTGGGRCAWWVGDEGVKARVDLASHTRAGAAAGELAMAAPRSGWRVVEGMEAYPQAGSAEEGMLAKVHRPDDLRRIHPSLAGRDLPHAATTWSRGVLSDNLRGGLKADLTPISWDIPRDLPDMGSALIPQHAAPGLGHLQWRLLRDFARMRDEMRDGVLGVRHGDEGGPGIAPVTEELRLLFGVRVVPAGGGFFRAQPCVKLAVRLSNPYTVPLAWDRPLELEFFNATHPLRVPTRLTGSLGNPPILPRLANEPALLNSAVFVIPPQALAPGETATFTHSAPMLRGLTASTSRYEVPLAVYDAASGGDFRNCLMFDHPSRTRVDGEWVLHIQEETGTSQMDVAIRLQGVSGELRRIERLEINNFHHGHCALRIPAGMAGSFTHPVPLQLFVLGSGLENGPVPSAATVFGVDVPVVSAVRSFADFNLRARHFRKPIICHQPPPYGMRVAADRGELPDDPPGGLTGSAFTRGLDVMPPRRVWLHPPRQLVSLAQFQHADLTGDDAGLSVGHQPGNAFANSHAPPFVRRERVVQERGDFKILGFAELEERRTNYYDISHLLNASLWDAWFFSTLPEDGAAVPENPRLVEVAAASSAEEAPAAKWLLDGAFNVNSVEPGAWAAVLAGLEGIRHPSESAAGEGAMLPRSPGQLRVANAATSAGDAEAALAGFRRLSSRQVAALADEIVRQVRLRGPFASVSHFVNRALVPMARNPELGRGGALQCAIDRSGINLRTSPDGSCGGLFDAGSGRLRHRADEAGAPAADVPGQDPTRWPDSPPDGIWPAFSLDTNPGSLAGIHAERGILTNHSLRGEQGHRCTGMPGWLTQADVLQVIGPSLATRSDTFRIRACGEASSEAGGVAARVYCEAVVQRMPAYVDPADTAHARGGELARINLGFGRAFRIVSFRWLAEQEI